jgi:transcriptional regulator GlxA family with amidase domain
VAEVERTAVSVAVEEMLRAGGLVEIGDVAAGVGLSPRQFERRFRAEVGLPPKLFCRIQRFQRIFQALESGPAKWADVAVDCGYYDQAHLIRDFRAFAGETPVELMAEDTDLARHFLRRRV